MPASITIALVAFSPNVIGSRIEMPASGPMPGSTPTSVPTRQPMKAYHSTAGCSATEKPSPSDSIALKSKSQYSGFKRRLQRRAEDPPRDHRQSDAVGGGTQEVLALDDDQQRKHEQRHRQDEAEPVIEHRHDARDEHDKQRMVAV